MTVAVSIRELIVSKYSPERLEVLDNSHLHAGHAGVKNFQPEVTHLKIVISGKDVEGATRIEKHKNLKSLLSEYFSMIHSIEVNLV